MYRFFTLLTKNYWCYINWYENWYLYSTISPRCIYESLKNLIPNFWSKCIKSFFELSYDFTDHLSFRSKSWQKIFKSTKKNKVSDCFTYLHLFSWFDTLMCSLKCHRLQLETNAPSYWQGWVTDKLNSNFFYIVSIANLYEKIR